MSLKKWVPWWGKIGLKLLLARLPLGYRIWEKAGIFVHGSMTEPGYAYGIFEKHFQLMEARRSFACLELGPGDSLFTAIIAPSFGGTKTYLVDSGNYAARDTRTYATMTDFLQRKGLKVVPMPANCSLEDVLARCSATYETDGLAALRRIPDKSVDLIFSNAVLEHVERSEFTQVLKELRRILRDDGVSTHQVDLQDHLDHALNNLRFSEKIWESDRFRRSGFYTNRIRYQAMLEIFRNAGFEAEVKEDSKWAKLPTPRKLMSPEFASLADADLCIKSFFVILRPR